jgi:hypothetical protein
MNGKPYPAHRRILFAFMILLLAALACALPGSTATEESGPTDLEISIAQTATARAQESGGENNDAVGTAQAEATQTALDLGLTQEAQADLDAQEEAATAAVFAPILAELPKFGVDPEKGRPAWLHPPLTIDVEGYMEFDYKNNYIGTVAEDFVMSADITWNTRYGTTGCGFILRTNGDEDDLDAYLMVATRFGNGRVLFGTVAGGDIVNGKDFYAYGLDPAFDWRNDTTNRMTVVARGPILKVFTNDTMIAEFNVNDPPQRPYIPPPPGKPGDDASQDEKDAYQIAKDNYDDVVADINGAYNQGLRDFEAHDVEFLKGLVAFVALNESGTTHCEFNNAWLWLIEE